MLKRKLFINVVILLLLIFLPTTDVFAHAKLEKSSPQKDEILNQAPKTVELFYSVAIQSSGVNSVIVTDENGKRVDKNNLTVSEDGKKLAAELGELGPGIYKVDWRVISTDDHTIRGEFSFSVKVDKAENAKNENEKTVNKDVEKSSDSEMEDHSHHNTVESGTSWWQSVVRWFLYLAMFVLFGGFAFRLFVLKPTLTRLSDLSDEEKNLGLEKSKRMFLSLSWLSLIILLVVIPIRLLLQTSSVFGESIVEAFSPSKLMQILTQTGFGFPWALQFTLMILLFVVILLIKRDKDLKNPYLWAGLLLGSFLLLTPSLSGHARAASKEYSLAIISDWIHLIAGGIWIGGLVHLFFTSPKAFENAGISQKLQSIVRMIPLFSRLAIAATVLIFLTGIYNSWIHLESVFDLFNTTYGFVLLIKILLVLPMIGLGGLNGFILHPRMQKILSEDDISESKYRTVSKKFYRSVSFEIILGVLVLIIVSVLTFLPPGK